MLGFYNALNCCGSVTELPFTETSGIGLLGISERITALGGQLTLATVQPHGLKVEVWLPIISITEPLT